LPLFVTYSYANITHSHVRHTSPHGTATHVYTNIIFLSRACDFTHPLSLTHTHAHTYIYTPPRAHTHTHTHRSEQYLSETTWRSPKCQTSLSLSLSLSHTHAHKHTHTHMYTQTHTQVRAMAVRHDMTQSRVSDFTLREQVKGGNPPNSYMYIHIYIYIYICVYIYEYIPVKCRNLPKVSSLLDLPYAMSIQLTLQK